MNKRDLELARKANLELVETDKYRPKINCLEVNINNTFKHELGKFLMDWMIKKGVPADCASTFFEATSLKGYIDDIDTSIIVFCELNAVKLKKHEVPSIVSEARMKDGSRIDLYNLDSGERIEIVQCNDKSVVPYDDKTVIVRV